MEQYLAFPEKILLLLYYCIRLAFQLLPARRHASPQVEQSSEQPQAYTQLLDYLRGQTVKIYDVDNVYSGWPAGINPHVERLRLVADEKLEKLISNKKRLEKLKSADFALSAAMWWPRASFDDLVLALSIVIWLFTWDDDIEEKGGSVYDNFQAAQIRREETLQYVTYSLGFKVPESYIEPTNALVLDFRYIGDSLCKAYSVEQRQRFLNNMKVYIQGSRVEQELRISGRVPTVEEYWDYRMRSSAVDVTSSMTEFSIKGNLPQYIFEDANFKSIWRETNVIISASNDMLSIKKEFANGQIDNLVSLLSFNENIRAQDAMDKADTMVRSAKARFENARKSLETRYSNDTVVGRQVHDFIEGCKYNITGNHNWSLISTRYGLAKARKGNSLVFTF
ncbi:hypothetical protein ABVK25_000091 [Lepraria finkii]|uniref:Terpene synthase n=1 Tax=Lepraria finkii TaxID=1340010 RepID=A0ABR4BM70_9LECA